MGKEQVAALREEVDKLLKAGFIEQVDTCEWVSPNLRRMGDGGYA